MNVLITGCSRGIGLDLCRQALTQKHRVLAAVRDPKKSTELTALKAKYPDQLEIIAADMKNPEASGVLLNAAKDFGGIDILINNAGVLLKSDNHHDLTESFQVNTIAPFLITQALLPILKDSKNPKVISVSSVMGSISDNSSGGYYGYRASKSALNMINKSLSLDNPWLTAIVVHPGWVQTEMGGAQATLPIEESAKGLWTVINETRREQSGQFFNYQGKKLEW